MGEVWPAQCAWGLEQAPGAQVLAHYGGVCGAFGYDMGVSGCGLVEDATQTTQGTNASKLSADAEVFVPRNWKASTSDVAPLTQFRTPSCVGAPRPRLASRRTPEPEELRVRGELGHDEARISTLELKLIAP